MIGVGTTIGVIQGTVAGVVAGTIVSLVGGGVFLSVLVGGTILVGAASLGFVMDKFIEDRF